MFMSNSVDSADDLVGTDTIVGFGGEGLLCGAAGDRQLIPSPADQQPARDHVRSETRKGHHMSSTGKLSFLSALALSALAWPALAEDGKAYTGSSCQPMSFRPTAPSGLAVGGVTISNFSTSFESVACPVGKDVEAGRIKRAEVMVIDRSPVANHDIELHARDPQERREPAPERDAEEQQLVPDRSAVDLRRAGGRGAGQLQPDLHPAADGHRRRQPRPVHDRDVQHRRAMIGDRDGAGWRRRFERGSAPTQHSCHTRPGACRSCCERALPRWAGDLGPSWPDGSRRHILSGSGNRERPKCLRITQTDT